MKNVSKMTKEELVNKFISNKIKLERIGKEQDIISKELQLRNIPTDGNEKGFFYFVEGSTHYKLINDLAKQFITQQGANIEDFMKEVTTSGHYCFKLK